MKNQKIIQNSNIVRRGGRDKLPLYEKLRTSNDDDSFREFYIKKNNFAYLKKEYKKLASKITNGELEGFEGLKFEYIKIKLKLKQKTSKMTNTSEAMIEILEMKAQLILLEIRINDIQAWDISLQFAENCLNPK